MRLLKKKLTNGLIVLGLSLGLMVSANSANTFNFNKVEMLAEQGDASQQNTLGNYYSEFGGVNKDYMKAIYWYEKAAQQGHIEAQFNLGLMYAIGFGNQDYQKAWELQEKAANWYKKAAKQGHMKAQFNLGLLYKDGVGGVEQDDASSSEWIEKAAQQGYVYAQAMTGISYDNGIGLPKNYQKAAEWYQKAANQGDGNSQLRLGSSYSYGRGVRQNKTIAKEWYGKACDRGEQKGCDYYRELNEQGY